ncbi:hypothetical protein B0T26DRAFT_399627 [Lasiosphaeria miniovina]|uniref:Uncharacterized protein n=1 Tax=Lasiosphaeria miniovina TaxID=1954250 RepID=A0AA40A4R4_9PEZI|nr:uncharacterized protein B0T26DRAFT_399627 [Lasiosphaeria miniovina]KAK0709240.1 hypothetical protein B0T26DRAFT_399627 [Lasiosphaeria miniovina]
MKLLGAALAIITTILAAQGTEAAYLSGGAVSCQFAGYILIAYPALACMRMRQLGKGQLYPRVLVV